MWDNLLYLGSTFPCNIGLGRTATQRLCVVRVDTVTIVPRNACLVRQDSTETLGSHSFRPALASAVQLGACVSVSASL